MKKILTGLCAFALMVPTALGVAACGCKKGETLDARDVYALSAIASVDYLNNLENSNSAMLANLEQAARPDSLSESSVQGIKDTLSLFDDIIKGGKIDQTVSKNTSSDPLFSEYNFVMNISVYDTTFQMYYDEIETKTKREIEDEKEEINTSTTLSGVMVVSGSQYEMFGKREVETEGSETEASIEFTTKSKSNPDNYITVSQSVEQENGETEIKYEYKIYREGTCIRDIEVEIEDENNQIEIEVEFKDLSTGVLEKTKYEIKKYGDNFAIEYFDNGKINLITATPLENGYTFTYSNGFSETINF